MGTDVAFDAFADSLEEDGLFDDEGNGATTAQKVYTWQESLDALLDPLTPPGDKQVFLSDLVSANDAIRQSLEDAVRKRTLDPILTPTGRKLQDGTRAVARQITNDIIPSLVADGPRGVVNTAVGTPPLDELPTLVPKIGSRILDAISTQAKRGVQQMQEDLSDPATRIPQRISQQTADLAQEARNMFRETPEGLLGPRYTLVEQVDGYEIRDYEGYRAAGTSMSKVGEPWSVNDMASAGTAFNTLAAYIFGANEQEQTLDMTTPVVTTSDGEMRFYLETNNNDSAPTPLESGEFYERGAVQILKVAGQRLAVARFTGFVTEGEVARQKDALLTRLKNDGVEIDVPHGALVPHKILQYNPPYTIPIVRRNEIAIPVRVMEEVEEVAVADGTLSSVDVALEDGDADILNGETSINDNSFSVAQGKLKKEWEVDEDEPGLSPSDVE